MLLNFQAHVVPESATEVRKATSFWCNVEPRKGTKAGLKMDTMGAAAMMKPALSAE